MQAAVASVSYAADGRSLASGSADGAVIVWGRPGAPPALPAGPWPGSGSAPQDLLAGQGTVAHTHAAAVAAVAFSPAGAPLASAAGAELALWSPRGRVAARHKVRAPCVCESVRQAAWPSGVGPPTPCT
jgi:WD40 repeat protein